MKSKSMPIYFSVFFSAALFAEPPPSHCNAEEEILFNCKLENSKKILSLCASKNFASETAYIQYRFGLLDKQELVFPKKQENSNEQFLWQSEAYSGGWDTRVQFSIGDYKYQIYDKAYKESITSKEYLGGILVLKKDKKIAELKCDKLHSNKPIYSLNQLSDKVPNAHFFDDF